MLTEVTGRSRLRSGRATRRSRLRGLAWALALAIALTTVFLLALRQSLSTALTSDGASNILQGQAMLHGNPLLRGWWTSDVSFYTTELPEYALVVAARGLSPDVVHICGAVTYTLTVALAGLLARGRVTGPAGLRRAGIAVAIMLAPSVLGGTEVFLENPDHFGTSAPVLLVLLLIEWGDRRGERAGPPWCVPVAVGAVLALTQVGDELSLIAAAVPIAAVCAVRLAAAAVRGRARTALRADGLLAAAALISVAVASLAQWALRAAGGFDQRAIPGARLASLGQIPGNAAALWQSLILLFGANNPGKPRQPLTISHHVPLVLSADLHVVGLLAAGAGLIAGIAASFLGRAVPAGRPGRPGRDGQNGRDRVNQILVTAIGVTLAAALLSLVMRSLTSAHEIAILLPLAAALAGRTLPSAVRWFAGRQADRRAGRQADRQAGRQADRQAGRRADRQADGRPRRLRVLTMAATVALAGWLLAGLAEAGYAAAWPPTPVPVQTVADWLVAHHLRDGLAAYWQGSETTVAAGGRVLVAPVTASGGAADHWEASSAWYQPSEYRPTFVIAELHPAQAEDSLSVESVRARFGQPAAEYHVGIEIVMIYRYNLLTRLAARTFPGPS